MKSIRSILVVTAILVAVVTAYWYISSYKPKSKATNYIANLLKDPESAKFRNVRELKGGTVCGEVNGKNLHGAYVGFKPFVYAPGDKTIIPEAGFIGDAIPDGPMHRAIKFVASEECEKSVAEN